MLEGKVAVVVGGEGPLGRAVTKKFLAEGARLVLAWNSSEEWREAGGQIAADFKERYIDICVDATREDQAEELMKKARETFGSVDILLHMVGMFHAGQMLWETDVSTFDKLIEINLKSAFLCSKYAVRAMMEKGQGRIVFFPAALAVDPSPRCVAYAISKSGLITLMLGLRAELKDTRINVNCVMPSIMDTPKTRRMPNAEPDKWVKPSEVADLLSSLCSNECDAVSGSIIKVLGKV